MDFPYRWNDIEGRVRAEIRVNDDPTALGCPECARGFPYLWATVEPREPGYQHLRCWLQMMRHSRDESGFSADQFPAFVTDEHPFCCWSPASDFFDAPYSDEVEDLDFLAHTFFCALEGQPTDARRQVRAILGFEWGFSKRGEEIESFGPRVLSSDAWEDHRDLLEERYPDWPFAPGFAR